MRPNQYVRDGQIIRGTDGVTMLTGTRKLSPEPEYYATVNGAPRSSLSGTPRDMIGQPNEMIFRVAGVMYFPTKAGYEKI